MAVNRFYNPGVTGYQSQRAELNMPFIAQQEARAANKRAKLMADAEASRINIDAREGADTDRAREIMRDYNAKVDAELDALQTEGVLNNPGAISRIYNLNKERRNIMEGEGKILEDQKRFIAAQRAAIDKNFKNPIHRQFAQDKFSRDLSQGKYAATNYDPETGDYVHLPGATLGGDSDITEPIAKFVDKIKADSNSWSKTQVSPDQEWRIGRSGEREYLDPNKVRQATQMFAQSNPEIQAQIQTNNALGIPTNVDAIIDSYAAARTYDKVGSTYSEDFTALGNQVSKEKADAAAQSVTIRPFVNMARAEHLDLDEFGGAPQGELTNRSGNSGAGSILAGTRTFSRTSSDKVASVKDYANSPNYIAKHGKALSSLINDFPQSEGEDQQKYNERIKKMYDKAVDSMSTVSGMAHELSPTGRKKATEDIFGAKGRAGSAHNKTFYVQTQDGTTPKAMSYNEFVASTGYTPEEVNAKAAILYEERPDNNFTPAGYTGAVTTDDGKEVQFTVSDNNISEQRKKEPEYILSRPLYDLNVSESEPVTLPNGVTLKLEVNDKWDSEGNYTPRKDNYEVKVYTPEWSKTQVSPDQESRIGESGEIEYLTHTWQSTEIKPEQVTQLLEDSEIK